MVHSHADHYTFRQGFKSYGTGLFRFFHGIAIPSYPDTYDKGCPKASSLECWDTSGTVVSRHMRWCPIPMSHGMSYRNLNPCFQTRIRKKIISEQAKSNGKRMQVNSWKEFQGVETTMYNQFINLLVQTYFQLQMEINQSEPPDLSLNYITIKKHEEPYLKNRGSLSHVQQIHDQLERFKFTSLVSKSPYQ